MRREVMFWCLPNAEIRALVYELCLRGRVICYRDLEPKRQGSQQTFDFSVCLTGINDAFERGHGI